MKDPTPAAFPQPSGASSGLTKREFIAAHILAGICGNACSMNGIPHPDSLSKMAGLAVRLADALLVATKEAKPDYQER